MLVQLVNGVFQVIVKKYFGLLFQKNEIVEEKVAQLTIIHQLFQDNETSVHVFYMRYDNCSNQVYALNVRY